MLRKITYTLIAILCLHAPLFGDNNELFYNPLPFEQEGINNSFIRENPYRTEMRRMSRERKYEYYKSIKRNSVRYNSDYIDPDILQNPMNANFSNNYAMTYGTYTPGYISTPFEENDLSYNGFPDDPDVIPDNVHLVPLGDECPLLVLCCLSLLISYLKFRKSK